MRCAEIANIVYDHIYIVKYKQNNNSNNNKKQKAKRKGNAYNKIKWWFFSI